MESGSRKVLVGLSGGVDSSVAAVLLKKARLAGGDGQAKYEVEGAYMQCWSKGPYCSTEKDRTDAARVATQLDIPFRVFNFEDEYRKKVLGYFFSEYKAGRTPNPDVMCNKEIKFGLFLNKAMDLGFDFVATGHYARVKQYQVSSIKYQASIKNQADQSLDNFKLLAGIDPNKDQSLKQYKLLAGIDPNKDQSYFLYTLKQDQLSKVLFPVGEYKKSEVRKMAKKFGLPTASKPDSQGICFVGPVNIGDFLRETIKKTPGNIIDLSGNTLGKHDGLAFYTIGQRRGVGVSKSVPHYVVEKKQETNELVVAPIGSEKLFESVLEASEPTWTNAIDLKVGDRLKARIRYRQPLVLAVVQLIQKDKIVVKFEEEQKAVTPGQSVVFYQNDEVLGGAIIS